MSIMLTFEVTLDEQRGAALQRIFPDDIELVNHLADYVHRLADEQIKKEELEKAIKAGLAYKAEYWQCGELQEKYFLTPEEACQYLDEGLEENTLAPMGVFGPGGEYGEYLEPPI